MWSNVTDWTHEEEVASDGETFDDRPAYLVKAPYQKTGARIDLPFNAVDTRRLLDAFLTQQVNSAESLAAWVKDKNHPK